MEEKSYLNEELSDYIKLQRFKNKLSQETVAQRLNVSRNTYSTWENSPIKVDLETLQKIGKAIGEDLLIFFDQYVAKCNSEK